MTQNEDVSTKFDSRMLLTEDPSPIESLLASIADTLEVPRSAYDQAKERYAAVGDWLCREGSSLQSQQPLVYAQGSFALGTVVKPLRGDDYDIDAVVELAGPRDLWTPASLKSAVGRRLRENTTYNGMIAPEGRRCWTLTYSAESAAHGFHMDLLPSVPLAASASAAVTAIAITNRMASREFEWKDSDPKRYASWFRERMRTISTRRLLSDKLAGVEQVPHYSSRTPLQCVVQILKRYRDVLFQNNAEAAPISVIITTLAAQAYEGEESLADSLFGILARIANFVQWQDGRIVIPNPVRPTENFADRWQGDLRKENGFTRWLTATENLSLQLRSTPPEKLEPLLDHVLGESSARITLAKYASERSAVRAQRTIRPPQAPTQTFGTLVRGVGGILAGWARLLGEALHRQALRWPMRPDGTMVEIRGTMVDSRGALIGRLAHGEAIPVGTALRFEAVRAELGGDIFWQITNTGGEAQRADDLRGRFEAGTAVKKETARYRGTHFVECFVVRDGNCVARSGEFVVNIQ